MCQSKGARRPRSDDVDAVMRLSVLDDTYYRDLLCEFGAMFAIANRIDTVHKLPWIGFQSWRAAGRKVQIMNFSLIFLSPVSLLAILVL